jgi:hypothetical protein
VCCSFGVYMGCCAPIDQKIHRGAWGAAPAQASRPFSLAFSLVYSSFYSSHPRVTSVRPLGLSSESWLSLGSPLASGEAALSSLPLSEPILEQVPPRGVPSVLRSCFVSGLETDRFHLTETRVRGAGLPLRLSFSTTLQAAGLWKIDAGCPRCRLVMNRKRAESSTSLSFLVMFITEPYCFTALLAVA